MRALVRVVICVCLILSCIRCSPKGTPADDYDGIEIADLVQGSFTAGDYPLQYERVDEVRVLDLRVRERLDDVVAGAKGEVELFKRLTAWARSQFEPGFPDPYPLCNGLSILSDIRSGKTGGFCGQYSYLLGDALKSFGYFALRYVELENESGASHFAVEVWCNDLGRWILLDPLQPALYDREGMPLSAVEIHDEVLAGRGGSVHVNRLPFKHAPAGRPAAGSSRRAEQPPPPPASASDSELLSLFYNVAVSTRNDFAHLERPLSLAERERIFLRYADPRVHTFRNLKFVLNSSRKSDLLPPMNQVAIDTDPEPGKDVLHVSLSTRGTCPHFLRYRVRIGEAPWKDCGPLIIWSLTQGDNTLEVRAVNAFEVLGPLFHIRVRV